MAENVFIRPGTVLIVLIAAAIGLVVVNWSQALLDRTGESSDQGSSAIECTTLDVNFASQENNGTHHTVFLQLNKDAEAVAVTFEGEDENVTRLVNDPAPGSISGVTAPLSTVNEIKANVKGCSRIFRD